MIRALLLAATLAAPTFAQPAPDAKPAAGDAAIPAPLVSVTRHRGVFGGQTIAFTATASETDLTDEAGKPVARIFSVSYTKDGPRDPRRPVTFLYNGGPGSGSLWLHMGAFGPKRVDSGDARDDGAPPYRIEDNPHDLLDATDLVFIDPVGTGFSRVVGRGENKDYWGVTADAKSVAKFIRTWLRDNDRWNSPKFVGGESYGTTRSAALVNELEGSYNDVALNGVILVSTILDFGAQSEVSGNEMQYVVNMPTMSTTAWHHKALGAPAATIEEQAARARAFAAGPYLAALMKGNALPAAERAGVRAELSRLTGLSESFLENADLRVTPGRFYKELLRTRGQTVGRLDSRYLGTDEDRAGEGPDNDPSFYGIDAAYTAAMNSWAREGLKFRTTQEYSTIGGVSNWDWRLAPRGGDDRNTYATVAPYLARALRENSGLRIFNAAGWYDFATPFMGAELSHTRPGFQANRVEFHYYDAGHMMYVSDRNAAKLSADVRAFIRAQAR